MQQGYTLGEASRFLRVDPKTVRRWCRILDIEPDIVSNAGRIKLYSQSQLDHIASILQRSAQMQSHTSQEPETPSLPEKKEAEALDPWLMLPERLESLEEAVRATRETLVQALLSTRT